MFLQPILGWDKADCLRKEQLGRGSVGLANSQRHFWGSEKQETLEVSFLQKISDGQFGENMPGHPWKSVTYSWGSWWCRQGEVERWLNRSDLLGCLILVKTLAELHIPPEN